MNNCCLVTKVNYCAWNVISITSVASYFPNQRFGDFFPFSLTFIFHNSDGNWKLGNFNAFVFWIKTNLLEKAKYHYVKFTRKIQQKEPLYNPFIESFQTSTRISPMNNVHTLYLSFSWKIGKWYIQYITFWQLLLYYESNNLLSAIK